MNTTAQVQAGQQTTNMATRLFALKHAVQLRRVASVQPVRHEALQPELAHRPRSQIVSVQDCQARPASSRVAHHRPHPNICVVCYEGLVARPGYNDDLLAEAIRRGLPHDRLAGAVVIRSKRDASARRVRAWSGLASSPALLGQGRNEKTRGQFRAAYSRSHRAQPIGGEPETPSSLQYDM